MKILVTGSIAYDTIMVFPDRFRNHLLADQLHILNVCVLAPEMRREDGGTAGNIGYNLRLLGESPLIMATVGEDIQPYLDRFDALGIATSLLKRVSGQFTAQAFIITDLDDNQITAFHPGAMNHAHVNRVGDVGDIALGIVAPDGKEGMQSHTQQFADAGIPFIFDPGQGLPLFSGPELVDMIERASYLTVNDYEAKLLSDRTGLSLGALAERVDALVVTRGGEGSVIHAGGVDYAIPAVKPNAVVDPTGCGDAYRAGLLYGIAHGFDWDRSGKLASVLGSLKIASRGAQNHVVNRDMVAALYSKAFGERVF